MSLLEDYAAVVGSDVIEQLRQLTAPLKGMKIVHVNSTRLGGGVAEILSKMVPLTRELGLETHWEVITGDGDFYGCTKSMHNGLQGATVQLSDQQISAYRATNAANAERLRTLLADADVVFIHDPQPALLLSHVPERRGKWVWRCHIDASRPHRAVWNFLRPIVGEYDTSVFSLASFAHTLPHRQYLIPPSIDPLAEKNIALDDAEIDRTCGSLGIDRNRPLLTQVSRFDRFKDPLGVIHAHRLIKPYVPGIQLVLAGGGAADDPEGDAVLQEVRSARGDDPDVHVLLLPADSHRTINALQHASTIVLQKSLREGFGLTVTEALWKGRPVIGGDVGGIRLQVINYQTGFLVNTPEGAALRIRYLLREPARIEEMGRKGQELVRENFLITRHLREYLTLAVAMHRGFADRIELS